MEFTHLNDLYTFRYGLELPFEEAQVEEWLYPEATNSDEQYRYFHRRYTAHLRGDAEPDDDFDDMLELFSGDLRAISVVSLKTETIFLSFFFDAEQSQLLGVFPLRAMLNLRHGGQALQ